MFVTPKWKKEAQLLLEYAIKILNNKVDLLKPEQAIELQSRIEEVQKSLKLRDREKTEEATKQLEKSYHMVFPKHKRQHAFAENVESLFVSFVIVLAMMSFVFRPFRIPTGSMQPTLNGIQGYELAESAWPNAAKRLSERVLRGRTYHRVVVEKDTQLAFDSKARSNPFFMSDVQRFHFFLGSEIMCQNGSKIQLPGPLNPSMNMGLQDALRKAAQNHGFLKAGTVLCEGYLDTGDLVLVNRMIYHFRQPKRGETFVFNTTGIEGIRRHSGDQANGTHYIKRLCGVPGDEIRVSPPHLIVNEKIAEEPMIQRVMQGGAPFLPSQQGYTLPSGFSRDKMNAIIPNYLDQKNESVKLKDDVPVYLREYLALGDNQNNSLDSRYWGPVFGNNIVGPALFTLWPITSGHWGWIR